MFPRMDDHGVTMPVLLAGGPSHRTDHRKQAKKEVASEMEIPYAGGMATVRSSSNSEKRLKSAFVFVMRMAESHTQWFTPSLPTCTSTR